MEMVMLDTLDADDEQLLRGMIESHQQVTKSKVASHILSYWPAAFKQFIKVMPIDYKAVMEKKKTEKKAASLKATLGSNEFKISSN
jgi:glutamate synthase (NADPH/NADH) large chain